MGWHTPTVRTVFIHGRGRSGAPSKPVTVPKAPPAIHSLR